MNAAYMDVHGGDRRPARGREGRRSPASSSPPPRRPSSPAATSTTSRRSRRGGRRRRSRAGARGQGRCCAGSRRSASRSSPRSTARRSAAAWRSRLACHHRVIVDDPKAVLGFPEVQLGLLPGAGGVVRSVRMLGIVDALMQLLLQGQRHKPAQAKEIGFVDEVVATREELVPAAKAWIAGAGRGLAGQPWDAKGYKIPGGTPSNPKLAANLPAFPANLRKQLKGANYPAPHHIMAAAVEGAQVDFDTAIEIEGRYFVDLVTGQVAKNMIQAFFFDLQQVNGDRGRPEDIEPFKAKKVVVLGAGMMGAAIAYVCAKAGIEVVLKDVALEAAADAARATRRSSSPRASSAARHAGEGRRAARADHARPTTRRRRRRRPRDRGRVRGPEGQGAGVRRDRAASRRRRAAGLQHLDAADHRARRGRLAPGRLHRAALLQPRGQDAAAGDHQGRADVRRDASTARSTSPSRSARRRSSSTTRAASSPRA